MSIKNTIVLFLLLGSPHIHTQPGCMSKSQKLKQTFDTKAWHYVACNCDCKKQVSQGLYAQKENKCIECGHRHEPRPLIFMQQLVQNKKFHSTLPPSAQESLQDAIARWRRSK